MRDVRPAQQAAYLRRRDAGMSSLFHDRCDKPEQYFPLLQMLAKRMTAIHRDPYLLQELIQAGYIGIMRAARRYDPEKGTRFTTYAVPWILGEMRAALRNALDAGRICCDKRRIKRAREELTEKMGREPDIKELCEALDIDTYTLLLLDSNHSISMDDERCAALLRQDTAAGLEDRMGLADAVAMLDPQEQELIRLRYYSDKTQRETAQLLGKSQSAVSKAEQRALSSLRNLIAEEASG